MTHKLIPIAALALLGLSACEESDVRSEIAKYGAEQEQKFAANASASEEFLQKNRTEEGVKVTPSGLQYRVVRSVPSGATPTLSDEVTVNYEGKLINGTVFDSSYQRGEPVTFPLQSVIPGWQEAVQLMKPGEEFQFFIPADLAYGENAPEEIGPNQALIFRVELESFRSPDGKVVKAANAK